MTDQRRSDNSEVAPTAEKPVKPGKKPALLYRTLSSLIDGNYHGPLPKFPSRYQLLEPEPGHYLILKQSSDDVVKIVKPASLIKDIIQYTCSSDVSEKKGFMLTVAQAQAACDYWTALKKPIKAPAHIRFANEPGLCWRRVPFDPVQMPTPTFDELFSRMSNARAVKAWIGSLFDPRAGRQQYVWIYGEGGNGKGALGRFLYKLFGSTAQVVSQKMSVDNRFFGARFIDKRFVYWGDIQDGWLPTADIIKTMTGGDPTFVEYKGKDGFSVMLECMVMFLSNKMPQISSERADLRRIIFSEIGRYPGTALNQERYNKLLWAEAPGFIEECIGIYKEMCPDNEDIKTEAADDQVLHDHISTLEEHLEVVFERNFTLDPLQSVSPNQMQQVLAQEFRGDNVKMRKQEFMAYMRNKYGVRKKGVRIGEVVRRTYAGIRYTPPYSSMDTVGGDL